MRQEQQARQSTAARAVSVHSWSRALRFQPVNIVHFHLPFLRIIHLIIHGSLVSHEYSR